MWFDFKISTKQSYFIVLAIVTLACSFVESLQIETNGNTKPFKKFIKDLYDSNKSSEILNQKEVEKSQQVQNIPSSVVLMMKLISYYEDKFKIANHEPTEKGTTEIIQTQEKKININNKIMPRIGFHSKDFYGNSMMIPDVVIA